MAVCQNLVPLVNIKIAGKWMFIPLKMVLIGIDPYPNMDEIPSGKLTVCYGKSPCLMGKLTISMVIFHSYVTNYQRVIPVPSICWSTKP